MATNLTFQDGVALVGGGAADRAAFHAARALAPHVVAADGGADRLAAWRIEPSAIIGDMDSLADAAAWKRKLGDRFIALAEQNTTDLEKCLYATTAPFYVGVGFLGRRMDHSAAALNILARYPEKRLLLIGEEEVVFHAPATLRLTVEPGARISFFPLREVEGEFSRGLAWPVGGVRFQPDGRIGTSNEAASALVEARFSGPGMVVMVERRYLGAALSAISPGGAGRGGPG